jgi:hypothetical protein
MNQEHADSGHVGYYTPQNIIDAARQALGGAIMLDPASCEEANSRVGALMYYTEADDGLSLPWFGTVWMNHPFSRDGNPKWTNRLIGAYTSGEIEAACCITWASLPEEWFRPLLAYPQCFPHGRVHYLDSRTGRPHRSAPKGSVITYLGQNPTAFAEAFRHIGTTKIAF